MTHDESRWLRYSLVFVWLATALVSVVELNGDDELFGSTSSSGHGASSAITWAARLPGGKPMPQRL